MNMINRAATQKPAAGGMDEFDALLEDLGGGDSANV